MSKAILILHGWGASSKSWLKIKKVLEKEGLKVYVPDFPGFGVTPDPPKPWSVDNYTEWVRNYSEKEGLSQFFLLGHSFGGRVAVKFAVDFPEKISKLILVDSAGFGRKQSWGWRQRITIKLRKLGYFLTTLPILKIFYPIFRKIAYILAGTKDYYLIKSPVMKETFKKIIAEDLTRYLSEIKIPTLIIWGKKDKMVPIKIAYSLKEKISNSQLEILPDIGHNPHLETPEKLAEIIIQFIKS
jgi:pimeloyl-ACP methyl ester carboxylesterase